MLNGYQCISVQASWLLIFNQPTLKAMQLLAIFHSICLCYVRVRV